MAKKKTKIDEEPKKEETMVQSVVKKNFTTPLIPHFRGICPNC